MQTNCLYSFNRYFLFAVVVAAATAVVAFALASISMLFFVVFASILVSFVSISISISFAFSISLLLVVILSIFFVFFNLFSDCNIEYICKLKKIETELTIYNSCLILLLYICSQIESLYYISFDSKLHYQMFLLLCSKVSLQIKFYCYYCVSSYFAHLFCCCYCNNFFYCCQYSLIENRLLCVI